MVPSAGLPETTCLIQHFKLLRSDTWNQNG